MEAMASGDQTKKRKGHGQGSSGPASPPSQRPKQTNDDDDYESISIESDIENAINFLTYLEIAVGKEEEIFETAARSHRRTLSCWLGVCT